MSHYILTDKKLIKTSDNRIMLLCKVADSSVRNQSGAHPKNWTFCTFKECTDGFLHPKDAYDKRVKLLFEEEIRKLQDYYDKYEPGRVATEDSYVYDGNTYNGSGKIKALRSFYSARRTIPAEAFFQKYFLYMEFAIWNEEENTFVHKNYKISSEKDLIDAHDRFAETKKNEKVYITVDVIEHYL